MFGVNEIVGKTFFKKANPDTLLVTNRFFTLQGEGPYRGFPAYFIRLAKCNLACSFCDTYFDSGDWQSFTALLDEADCVITDFFTKRNMITPKWAQGFSKKIVLVITGGEPSLQNNVSEFLKKAQNYFQYIQIESNGISLLPDMPKATTLVVSPKCVEKNGEVLRYLEPNKKVLQRADYLKFVISAKNNRKYLAYSEIPEWAHQWAAQTGKQIFVSPMNIYKKEPASNKIVSFWEPDLLDLEQNQLNHEYAAEYCMKYGFILNLQIHLFASLP